MRIKRFEAKDTTTAIAMVKQELGDDAVILATRTLGSTGSKDNGRRGGPVEVIAAIDYDIDAVIAEETPLSDDSSDRPFSTGGYGYETIRRKSPPDERWQAKAPTPHKRNQFVEPPQTVTPAATRSQYDLNDIHSETQELRMRFANLFQKRPAIKTTAPPRTPHSSKTPPTPAQAKKPRPEDVAKWRDQLIDKIQLKEHPAPGGSDQPMIMALVGATGVGKTTTSAKLAAWYSLREGKKVALLSMDCYRIGATDQLRTYARIMRVPCEIVLRKNDLQKALAKHADKDLIIIDTAGKSPYDPSHIDELLEWFGPYGTAIETHLVLSATTKKEDLANIITAYEPLAVSSLILTKLDETRAYAALCQQVVKAALPVSYLCTGQKVPEDFQLASKNYLDTLFKKGWSAVAQENKAYSPPRSRVSAVVA